MYDALLDHIMHHRVTSDMYRLTIWTTHRHRHRHTLSLTHIPTLTTEVNRSKGKLKSFTSPTYTTTGDTLYPISKEGEHHNNKGPQ